VVASTNASLATFSCPPVTAEEHRRDFRRPISAYYSYVLGRRIDDEEFVRLDNAFHAAYRDGLTTCGLRPDAEPALAAWAGSQSLLSMWFHTELVPLVEGFGLTRWFARVDGLRAVNGGGHKAEHLVSHLAALGIAGSDAVLIGDSLDDAHAAEAVGAGCVLFAGGFTEPGALRGTGLPVATSLPEAVELAART
jgi:phosphoglycolate phosphatase-like HAD superfamily hydrolase